MKSSVVRVFRNQGRDRSPVPLARRNGTAGLLSGFTLSDREALLRAMGALGDVYSIVSLLASSTSKTGWHLYRKEYVDGRRKFIRNSANGKRKLLVWNGNRYTTADHGSDQRTEIVRHAALDLWNRPNPWYTQRAYVEGFQQHLELTGEAYWVLNLAGNSSLPLSMFYVLPHRMEPVPDPETFIAGWIYTGPNGEQIPLQPNEVIGPPSLAFPNPWDPFHGLGPAQAVLMDIQAAQYSVAWNRNFFYNNAEPGGVITVPVKLDDREFDELTLRWREGHRGISAAGAVAVLEAGAQWQGSSPTHKDMEFGALRLMTGDIIRRVWRVHKHMLGDVDDVNRANAETAEETFARWTTSDRLDRIRDVLNVPFLSLYKAEDAVEFDYDDPVPDNREADNMELTAKSTAAQRLVEAGFDPEDVLEVVGLPAMSFTGSPQVTAAPEITPEQELPPAAQGDSAQSNSSVSESDLEAMSNMFRKLGSRDLTDMTLQLRRMYQANGHSHKAGVS